jgi:hypothetical protein
MGMDIYLKLHIEFAFHRLNPYGSGVTCPWIFYYRTYACNSFLSPKAGPLVMASITSASSFQLNYNCASWGLCIYNTIRFNSSLFYGIEHLFVVRHKKNCCVLSNLVSIVRYFGNVLYCKGPWASNISMYFLHWKIPTGFIFIALDCRFLMGLNAPRVKLVLKMA